MTDKGTARAYHVTKNNPGMEVMEYLDVLAKKWVRDGIAVKEVGESGTEHIHVYVRCSYPVRFNAVRKMFEGAHIEVARGTYAENEAYLSKQSEPVYFYVEDGEVKRKEKEEKKAELRVNKKGVWATVKEMIDQGMEVDFILNEFPSMLVHRDKIERYAAERIKKKYTPMTCIYMFGKPGVGKTSMVYEVEGYDNVYRVVDYKNPFDQYNGEGVIVLDDYRGQLEESFLLALMDVYPVFLPCRYRDKYRKANKIYILSNMEPRQIFGFFGFMVEAFTRRCKMILEITPLNRDKMKEVIKDED